MCLKTTTIVPNESTSGSPNDFRPVALIPIITNCFERLVLPHLKSSLLPTLDHNQFAYHEDAISMGLHEALTHLDSNNSYIRMLLININSSFNTVILASANSPATGLPDQQTPSVRLNNLTLSTMTLNTGISKGCVLSPLLYSLFTHDCSCTWLQHHCQVRR